MKRLAEIADGRAEAMPQPRWFEGRAGPTSRPRFFGALIILVLLSGCTLLRGPKRDRTDFFTLEAAAPAGTPAAVTTPRVLLRTVELPAYLQRSKAMTVRQKGGDIRYVDLAWWSESLDLGIARVLREDLGRLGVPTASRRDEDFVNELTVRIERAEGVIEGKAGRVEFVATFELNRGDGPRPVSVRRTFTAKSAAWDGKDYGALAKTLSGAVAELAAAIREGLPRG